MHTIALFVYFIIYMCHFFSFFTCWVILEGKIYLVWPSFNYCENLVFDWFYWSISRRNTIHIQWENSFFLELTQNNPSALLIFLWPKNFFEAVEVDSRRCTCWKSWKPKGSSNIIICNSHLYHIKYSKTFIVKQLSYTA